MLSEQTKEIWKLCTTNRHTHTHEKKLVDDNLTSSHDNRSFLSAFSLFYHIPSTVQCAYVRCTRYYAMPLVLFLSVSSWFTDYDDDSGFYFHFCLQIDVLCRKRECARKKMIRENTTANHTSAISFCQAFLENRNCWLLVNINGVLLNLSLLVPIFFFEIEIFPICCEKKIVIKLKWIEQMINYHYRHDSNRHCWLFLI